MQFFLINPKVFCCLYISRIKKLLLMRKLTFILQFLLTFLFVFKLILLLLVLFLVFSCLSSFTFQINFSQRILDLISLVFCSIIIHKHQRLIFLLRFYSIDVFIKCQEISRIRLILRNLYLNFEELIWSLLCFSLFLYLFFINQQTFIILKIYKEKLIYHI